MTYDQTEGISRTGHPSDPMARALLLARRAAHGTSPNPMVGAVLISNGQVVGEGFHTGAGAAHAEVVALEQAGDRARGATLWVTLEPCCTQGRTGACTERLLEAGVAEIRVATLDPNPEVNGQGVNQLRAAGVRVAVGEREEEARDLIQEFAIWIATGSPLVTLKFAMSLDGKVATAAGQSQWITSGSARTRAHQLRAEHDAVMVGSGTILADDPRLTARLEGTVPRQPLRVIVDSRLRTPPSARVFSEAGGAVLIATVPGADRGRGRALEKAGAEMLTVPAEQGRVRLDELMAQLGALEVTSVLAEGGPTLLGSLLEGRLGHRIAAFVAPVVVGGATAPGPFGGRGASSLEQSWRAHHLRTEAVGPDLLLTAQV